MTAADLLDRARQALHGRENTENTPDTDLIGFLSTWCEEFLATFWGPTQNETVAVLSGTQSYALTKNYRNVERVTWTPTGATSPSVITSTDALYLTRQGKDPYGDSGTPVNYFFELAGQYPTLYLYKVPNANGSVKVYGKGYPSAPAQATDALAFPIQFNLSAQKYLEYRLQQLNEQVGSPDTAQALLECRQALEQGARDYRSAYGPKYVRHRLNAAAPAPTLPAIS